MATLSGRLDAVGAALLTAEPEVRQDVTLNYGRLRYISDEYVIPTADELGTSAVVNFFEIPKGARVIEMFATADASGATGSATIGWDASEETDENGTVLEAADPDGFYTAAQFDPGNAALVRLAMAATEAGHRKLFAAKVQVTATVTQITADGGDDTWLLEAYIIVD